MRLAAAAWLARRGAQGRGAAARARRRRPRGRDRQAPGDARAVLPARELLGDLLLETGAPADALAEYEASLREAPNRFNGLAGAARAAAAAGDPARARAHYGALVAQCTPDSGRPELAEARKFLAGPPTAGGD